MVFLYDRDNMRAIIRLKMRANIINDAIEPL